MSNFIELRKDGFVARSTKLSDIPGIQQVCLEVYPFSKPWREDQLHSHLNVFPEGQLVIEDTTTGQIVGMAASLVIHWDDYEVSDNWLDFTEGGTFQNHDPENGRTLYGAEIMVRPSFQGKGLGKLLYEARRQICTKLKLLRIRAGARMRGYATYAEDHNPKEYIYKVMNNEIFDPTVSFQIKQGFKVISIVSNYISDDPETLGHAAVIEWLNPEVATEEHHKLQRKFFEKIEAEIKASR